MENNNIQLSRYATGGNGNTIRVASLFGVPGLDPKLVALLNDTARWGTQKPEIRNPLWEEREGCY